MPSSQTTCCHDHRRSSNVINLELLETFRGDRGQLITVLDQGSNVKLVSRSAEVAGGLLFPWLECFPFAGDCRSRKVVRMPETKGNLGELNLDV